MSGSLTLALSEVLVAAPGSGECDTSDRGSTGGGVLKDRAALGLGQATPHPERLAGAQRELPTRFENRATRADFLGGGCAAGAGRVALPVRMEERPAVHASAGAEPLPLPGVIHRAREPGHVAHGDHLSRVDGGFFRRPGPITAFPTARTFKHTGAGGISPRHPIGRGPGHLPCSGREPPITPGAGRLR